MSEMAPVVYLIDDDASMRAALEDLFASVGLQVCAFGSTDQFLAHRLQDAPACLVLDIRMPGQSGWNSIDAWSNPASPCQPSSSPVTAISRWAWKR